VVLGAFDAWLLMRGMRTLFVRVERQCQVLLNAAINVSAYAAVNVSLYAVRKGRAPVTGTTKCCCKCGRILPYVAAY
jgi:cystathionine beta-lyase/cystathionine gamma-synthase